MDRFDRIFELHKILKSRRTPVPRKEVARRLRDTLERYEPGEKSSS